ncbi:MAG: hypothetical protein HJJLKODD_01703 [Phycisphaerae bacterium]|nr:hypothetical protein [Phycisphaerae bacterium]
MSGWKIRRLSCVPFTIFAVLVWSGCQSEPPQHEESEAPTAVQQSTDVPPDTEPVATPGSAAEVTIEPADPLAPVALAGDDFQVYAKEQVTLDGSGSYHPLGKQLSYSWSKKSGPVVALVGSQTAEVHFTAPAVQKKTTLVVRLQVSDGQLVDDDEINIVIMPLVSDNDDDSSTTPGDQQPPVDIFPVENQNSSPTNGNDNSAVPGSGGGPPSSGSDNTNSNLNSNSNDNGNSNDNSGGTDPEAFVFQPSTANNVLNWEQFPEFHLPAKFRVIWGGPFFDGADAVAPALSHGFSHLASATSQQLANTTPQQRALMWYSVSVTPNPQPWLDRVPWGNDLAYYETQWLNKFAAFADKYPTADDDPYLPNVDLICLDVESHYISDADILSTRNHPAVPPEIKALPNAEYIDAYKRAMAELHTMAHEFVIELGFSGPLGIYGEPPVRRTVSAIPQKSWLEWTTQPLVLNFMSKDYTVPDSSWLSTFPGPMYEATSGQFPSTYYFYEYPESPAANPGAWSGAGGFLSYMLFNIEVNDAWVKSIADDDPVIVFQWMRFHCNGPCGDEPKDLQPIRPHMAEASAIFPIFGGAKGMWLWDYYGGQGSDPNMNFAMYEYYVYGLYRLSQYNDILEGDYTLYRPANARDTYTNSAPVWRGIVSEDGHTLLVAAHDPYAVPGEVTQYTIDYNGQVLGTITTTGWEIALQTFTIP